MKKSKESPNIQYIVSLLRQVIVFSIIVAVATIALCWESLPASLKKTVAFLSANPSDDHGMTPPKFRIDHHPFIDKTKELLPDKLEYRNIQVCDAIIDNTLLDRLHDELKQLGATSYRLTYWGDNRNMFRFSCQVPVSDHHPNVTQTFQSIAPDAIQSIQEVIDQIRKSSMSNFGNDKNPATTE